MVSGHHLRCWLLTIAILGACHSAHFSSLKDSAAPPGKRPRLFIRRAAQKLALANDLTCGLVGRAPIEPKHWPYYVILHDQATTPELVFLTDNPSAVVRCYAYRALADRAEIDLFPIALKHITDDDSVHTYCGCSGNLTYVSWEFRGRGKRAKNPLTPAQVKYLDSVRFEQGKYWSDLLRHK